MVTDEPVTLCLGGDLMIGRGVDQILPTPGDPRLAERQVRDARTYVELAEQLNGPIHRPVALDWPWGDALAILRSAEVGARVVNLETAVTARGRPAPGKSVHYRTHPAHVECLTAARLDVCSVANNHLLDFGPVGLIDTLDHLDAAGLTAVGAGRNLAEAQRPIRIPLTTGRQLVVSACATTTSGIPAEWAADQSPGVHLLRDLTPDVADTLSERILPLKRPGDLAMVSVHWGSNWGYEVPSAHVAFAHRLIDAGIDLVHGHSSHHPRPIEVYRGRLILYGCGDLVDDYEGISGYDRYRDDLRLLYLPSLSSAEGRVVHLRIALFQARRMRLERANQDDLGWMRDLLSELSGRDACIAGEALLELTV
jgi:poly-gamma-glutamate capsule biosynthesis protein CapA/YwtB (metallophosphatase superfamily)